MAESISDVAPASGISTRGRRRLRSLSLRARLLLGLVLVAALGLVVADVVIYSEIDSYLVGQVDQELVTPSHQLLDALLTRPFSDGFNFNRNVEPGTYGALISASGQTVLSSPLSGRPPSLPSDLVKLATGGASYSNLEAALANGSPHSAHFTVDTGAGSTLQYRVYAVGVPVTVAETGQNEPGAAVVALPLTSLDQTVHQLIVVELIVSAAVLLLLALLGFVVVRVGMRPLWEIERTAKAIAAGDLTQRVELDDPRSEVGRLGSSLNEMLGQIEHAFAEQRASEERLRQFLADASHELRTPVTSIRGYAELFRRGAASRPEDLARSLQRIEDESLRMGVLVDDLLLLARLDQGRPLEIAEVDLSSLVADAAADVQVLAADRAISVDLVEHLIVQGDEVRLHQVVANLFQNALRYSLPGTPVEVSLSEEGDTAVLRFTDHGFGMAAEHLPHVFERFYRADSSRARERGGSGLGLSIVASIVEAHRGSVSVSSVLHEGSVFTVELPLRQPVAPPPSGSRLEHWAEPEDGPTADLGISEALAADPPPTGARPSELAQARSETDVGTPGPL